MLREIVKASDDGLRLHPHEELSKMTSRILHSVPKRENHSVRIEDVESILALQKRLHGFNPFAGEGPIITIILQMIVFDRRMLRLCLAKSFLSFDIRNGIGR